MKCIFQAASRDYKDEQARTGAKLAKERKFWSIQALRSNDLRDCKSFERALDAAPQLRHASYYGELPVCELHLNQIRDVLKDAIQIDCQEKSGA